MAGVVAQKLERYAAVEIKKIKVSPKRQITIPVEFYEQLGIGKTVECYINTSGEMVIRPDVPPSGEFAEQILADLIKQGYQGQELMAKFIEMNRKIRPAVEAMIAEAEELARNFDGVDKTERLFGYHQ